MSLVQALIHVDTFNFTCKGHMAILLTVAAGISCQL